MSSKNDDDDGKTVILVISVIGAAFIVFAVIMALIGTAIAFALTILSIFAWNKPRRIGEFLIEPEQARAFVIRGVIGALLVVAAAGLLYLLRDKPIDWSRWYLVIGGYVVGSLGIAMLREEELPKVEQAREIEPPRQQLLPAPRALPSPPQRTLPRPLPLKPFRFAEWNDEEEIR